jgi:hypothetical protein
MSRNSPISVLAGAGMIAASLWVSVPIASSGSLKPLVGQTQYLPVQSISHEFGSKFMSGYFVQQGATCLVTLMVIEKSSLDEAVPTSATRVRLAMSPGQILGLDSEEGRSVNVTCGQDASTMLLDSGDRDKLVALQSLAAQDDVAKSEDVSTAH